MSTALTSQQKTEISTHISRDILSQALGVDNIDSVSIDDCIKGYKDTDTFETMAIDKIKQGADHNRGMYIEAIKVKDPEGWATIIEKKLNVKRNRAGQLSKYFRDSHSYETLVELNVRNDENTHSKSSLRLEDLSFPSTAETLRSSDGLTKKEETALQLKLKKEGMEKEDMDIAIARVKLVKKAESYTRSQLDKLWSQIVDNGLEIRDDGTIYKYTEGEVTKSNNPNIKDDSAEIETKEDIKLIALIQKEFDRFSSEMQNKSLELMSEPTRSEKFKELGWTDEDQELYDDSLKTVKQEKKIPQFFKDHYDSWKKVYKEISTISHPDKGGSGEAQSFINDVNSIMSKLKVHHQYDEVRLKNERITKEYDEWRHSQTDSITLKLDDFIESIKEDEL